MRKSRIFLTCSIFLVTIFQSLYAQEYGKASVYSARFQGGATASGEKFNHSDFTVAHRTHKFNTRLRITRVDNGRSVIVRVNDRGPFVSDCITDMSRSTATKLGISDDASTVQIKIEVVTDINIPLGTVTVVDKKKDDPTVAPVKVVVNRPKSVPMPDPLSSSQYSGTKNVEKRDVPRDYRYTPKSGENNAEKKNFTTVPPLINTAKDSGKAHKELIINPKGVNKEGYAVQVASMNQYESMMRKVSDLQNAYFKNILVTTVKTNKKVSDYKVMLGPFSSQEDAESYLKNVRKKNISGFIVNLKSLR